MIASTTPIKSKSGEPRFVPRPISAQRNPRVHSNAALPRAVL